MWRPAAIAQPVFRFAPSPNGPLHLGHARSALLNAAHADEVGGRLLLRIEDIDPARCRPEYEAAIRDDLAWLGLRWERPVRRQSEHMADYRAALDRLEARGLLYPCACSRAEIARAVAAREALLGTAWPRDPDGAPLYPGTCRDRPRAAAGAPRALRLDLGAVGLAAHNLTWREAGATVPAAPGLWGDVVLARRDVPTSYHLAVVVDDALQGVTDIVRGADLLEATAIHRLLQRLLDLPEPAYRHHALIRDAAGAKLSKSTRAPSLRALREAGMTPGEVRRLAGVLDRSPFMREEP